MERLHSISGMSGFQNNFAEYCEVLFWLNIYNFSDSSMLCLFFLSGMIILIAFINYCWFQSLIIALVVMENVFTYRKTKVSYYFIIIDGEHMYKPDF